MVLRCRDHTCILPSYLVSYLGGQLESMNLPVPEPGSGGSYSGRFVQRVPRSLHARLAAKAKQEGVSMNSLVTSMLAESLGKREPV